jgi:flagellar biosynthesis/type III secretory pathway chaperone
MRKPLIAAVRQLTDVLERENTALRSMDLDRAAGLVPEKTAAIADLMASGQPSSIPLDPALISAMRGLDRLSSENRKLLERAITVQQRVIGIVTRAAAAAVSEPSYGAKGQLSGAAAPMAFSARI